MPSKKNNCVKTCRLVYDSSNVKSIMTYLRCAYHGKPALKAELLASAALLGLLNEDPTAWFQNKGCSDGLSNEDIDALVEERNAAKKAKNFARADEIRDQLKAAGIQLEDTREGTRWSRG